MFIAAVELILTGEIIRVLRIILPMHLRTIMTSTEEMAMEALPGPIEQQSELM